MPGLYEQLCILAVLSFGSGHSFISVHISSISIRPLYILYAAFLAGTAQCCSMRRHSTAQLSWRPAIGQTCTIDLSCKSLTHCNDADANACL